LLTTQIPKMNQLDQQLQSVLQLIINHESPQNNQYWKQAYDIIFKKNQLLLEQLEEQKLSLEHNWSANQTAQKVFKEKDEDIQRLEIRAATRLTTLRKYIQFKPIPTLTIGKIKSLKRSENWEDLILIIMIETRIFPMNGIDRRTIVNELLEYYKEFEIEENELDLQFVKTDSS